MYPFESFRVRDTDEICRFIDRYPLATIVANDAMAGFVATHVPLIVQREDGGIVLRGHVMRASDHGSALTSGTRVFVCFHGPDAPILGSWQLTARFGGTWNYQAVHAHGTVQSRDGAALLAHLEELKNRFETSPDHRYASLPQDYVEALTPMIECIDIHVTEWQCIYKLSQNRRIEEFDRTLAALKKLGGKSAQVAEAMESRRHQYYPDA